MIVVERELVVNNANYNWHYPFGRSRLTISLNLGISYRNAGTCDYRIMLENRKPEIDFAFLVPNIVPDLVLYPKIIYIVASQDRARVWPSIKSGAISDILHSEIQSDSNITISLKLHRAGDTYIGGNPVLSSKRH
jgi:hypothetical protein